ncbi:MAG: DUF4169 family protein [Alphaproteobacteria bacterium]|jgi:hypothetical protein
MSEIINLRQARKNKTRSKKEKQAEQNRMLFGRTKAEKKQTEKESEKASKHLDGHKREKDEE